MEADIIVPTVHVPSKGYADNSNILNQVNYDLTISSLSVNTGNVAGGLTVTMTGTGFPFDSTKTFTLQICDVPATVISVSNTQIKFITSKCGTAKATVVQLGFNSKSATSDFTYTDEAIVGPVLSAISPSSYSPVLKGFMIITGSGFGTVPGALTVWLQLSSINKYQLNIIEVSDTQLKVRIPGGEASGEFRVIVTR